MDVDPIPLSTAGGRRSFFFPEPQVIRPLHQIGPVIYHGPSQIDAEEFPGWHEFPGAAIEYLSHTIAERLCALWAEPVDWARMRYWIEGVQLSVAEFASHLETVWAGEALGELTFLKLVAAEREVSP